MSKAGNLHEFAYGLFASAASEHLPLVDAVAKASFPELKVFAHSLFMCGLFYNSGKYRYSFWMGLMMTFIGGFFGGFTSNLLMNETPGIFKLNWIILGHFLAHWIICCAPYGLGIKAYNKIKPINMFCKMCSNVMRVHCIIDRLELAAMHFPGVFVSPILLGFIGGSGGGITCDTIDVFTGAKTIITHELASPTFATRSGLAVAVVYYLAYVRDSRCA